MELVEVLVSAALLVSFFVVAEEGLFSVALSVLSDEDVF